MLIGCVGVMYNRCVGALFVKERYPERMAHWTDGPLSRKIQSRTAGDW